MPKNRDMFVFFQYMIQFRKDHRVLRANLSDGACGFPDVSFHGVTPWLRQFADYDRYVGVMFAGKEKKAEIIYIASNAYWEPLQVTLPRRPADLTWKQIVDTWEAPQSEKPLNGNGFQIQGRSVMVFIADAIPS